MKTTCTNLAHPVATDGRPITVGGLAYVDLVCGTCGLPQGRRLVRKAKVATR